jgi:hypothetical protein
VSISVPPASRRVSDRPDISRKPLAPGGALAIEVVTLRGPSSRRLAYAKEPAAGAGKKIPAEAGSRSPCRAL